jgi:hypothetical protein
MILLLDFLYLTSLDQMAWQREIIQESAEESIIYCETKKIERFYEKPSYLKRADVVFIIFILHGIEISTHRMFHQNEQDSFNKGILYDLGKNRLCKKHMQSIT